MRLLRGVGAVLLLIASAAYSQTPGAEQKPSSLQFEVASIKPAAPPNPAAFQSGKIHVGMNIDEARVDIGFLSLADLIPLAFKVKQYQVTGPDWMASQRFDVLAKMPEGATKDDVPQMLQALLVERFKLTFHRESKENSVYALVVGKNGPKLKESPPDETEPPAADGKGVTSFNTGNGPVRITQSGDGTNASATIRTKEAGTTKMSMGPNGTMHLESSKVTLAQFADMLSRFMDRPVVDMTELKGNYQVSLDLSMEDLRGMARKAGVVIPAGAGPGGGDAAARPAADAASEPSGTSIFATVQQLGLKLDARKAPIDIIVIDHLEKTPTEN
jgi:uncharacterized protein (TIGR03435 family)